MRRTRKNLEQDLCQDTWPRRRKWMVTLLIWLVANAQYLIIWGNDTGLHQNALVSCLGAIIAIIGSYVFGAVWDDNHKRQWVDNSKQDLDEEIGE